MKRWAVLIAASSFAGCCLCGGDGGGARRADVAGHHESGAAYVECRPADAADCAKDFRDICDGDYDEVPADHRADYDPGADAQTRIAVCR